MAASDQPATRATRCARRSASSSPPGAPGSLPSRPGCPSYGGERRRVAGLRREEVALLAGVSPQYYVRLERGDATGVSESVIDGVAHALQLDEAERAHLLDLLRTAGTPPVPDVARRRPPQRVRPTVQRLLDSMHATPAVVLNGRLDIVAANALGRALFSPGLRRPRRHAEQRPVRLPRPAGQRRSSATGTPSRTTPSRSCVPKPAATPTTATSRTWSGSSPPAARSSGSGGPPMTSASTPPASSCSTTPSSATSTCRSSPSPWAGTRP